MDISKYPKMKISKFFEIFTMTQKSVKHFLYSPKTETPASFIKIIEIFLYSLKSRILVHFIKNLIVLMPSQKSETLEIQKFTHIRKKSKTVFTLPKQKFLKNFLYSTETKISKMFLFTQSKCFLKCFFIFIQKKFCV